MNAEPLITWHAPEHLHTEKKADWYWATTIITIALVIVSIIFAQYMMSVFIFVSVVALMIHVANPPRVLEYSINDRGVMMGDTLFPFVSLESFWIPHDLWPPRIIIKSNKTFMPLIVVFIDGVDPEEVRQVLLKYIAEKEHHEPILKIWLEKLGF